MAVKAKDQVTLAVLLSPSYVRLYYLKQASALNPPAVPTVHPPTGGWSTTEPTYTEGSTDTVYTVMLTAYGSVAFEYGPVQKSASFEAAKQAYNKAVAALTAGTNAENTAASALHVANLAQEFTEGLVSLDPEPPAEPEVGQVWVPTNEDGNATGLWRWNGEAWQTYTNIVGLLLVPTEDGGQTLIGPNGVEATQIVAELLRTDVLYADVAGVKTLVITDIPRENLAGDVGEVLDSAERIADRIIIDGVSGTITIARRASTQGAITSTRLTATSIDFVVDDKAIASIDSTEEIMTIANVVARKSLHVGAHQVRTLAGSQVTIWQHVGVIA